MNRKHLLVFTALCSSPCFAIDNTRGAIQDNLFANGSSTTEFINHIEDELSKPEAFVYGMADILAVLKGHEAIPTSQKLRDTVFAQLKKVYIRTCRTDGKKFSPQAKELLEAALSVWPDDDQRSRISSWFSKLGESTNQTTNDQELLTELEQELNTIKEERDKLATQAEAARLKEEQGKLREKEDAATLAAKRKREKTLATVTTQHAKKTNKPSAIASTTTSHNNRRERIHQRPQTSYAALQAASQRPVSPEQALRKKIHIAANKPSTVQTTATTSKPQRTDTTTTNTTHAPTQRTIDTPLAAK